MPYGEYPPLEVTYLQIGHEPREVAIENLELAEAEMPGYTQERAIVYALSKANGRWVCGTAFLSAYIPTYAQRVSALRKKGYTIESKECDVPKHHHRGAVACYRLKENE